MEWAWQAALQRGNIKSQVAEKKQKFSLTTNATSKRCYLSSQELKSEGEVGTEIACLQAEKTLESGYAAGPLFRNGEILFSMEKKLVPGSSQGSFAAAAGNATAPGNIMHNGFWSIDIYGIGLVCPALPPCDDLGSGVRQLKFVMGKVKVELLVGVT